MYLADALSRAFAPQQCEEQFERDIKSEKFIHLMSDTSYVTDRKLDEIKKHVTQDITMQLLIQQNDTGLPTRKSLLPTEMREYYPHRDKFTQNNGLIYAGQNILIPLKLRSDTLHKLHLSHQGVEKTKHLARQSILWPGMSKQIEDLIFSCPTCLRHREPNPREPLKPHQLPGRPWERVATDLFEWTVK